MGMLDGPCYSPESRGPYISGASLALFCLAAAFVGLRLYSRFVVTGTPGLDDLFIILSTILLIAQTFTMMMQVESGWGEHAYLLSLYQLDRNQMYRYQFIILNFVVAFFTKLSICWLVLRMTAGATTFGRQYRLGIKIFMWFLLVRVVTTVVVQIIPCWPISNFWHLETRPHACFNLFAWIISTSCIEFSTDIAVALIPLPLVYVVRIGTCERIVLLGLFFISIIPAVFGLTRTLQLIQWAIDVDNGSLMQSDFSWRWALVPFWSQVESTVAIMVSCTPMLCPLLKRWAFAFGIKTPRASSRSRPHSLVEAEEGRHRKSSGSFAGGSTHSHKIRINTSSKSLPLPSVHLNIHLPLPHLRTSRLRPGQQSRHNRPGPPPHIFSSHQLPETSLLQHPEPRGASTRPRPRSLTPRQEMLPHEMSQARSKTSRRRSLFESPTQEFSDSSVFPYESQSATVPAAMEAGEDWLTAYAFAVTTPTAPTLTWLGDEVETTPRSSKTSITGSSKCPSAKLSNIVRRKSKSRHDPEEGEAEAGGEDDEKKVRGEWREEMGKERIATNAKARRVMGERGSNETGTPGMQWMDEWWGMLGWRLGALKSTMSKHSGEPNEATETKGNVVSAVDYAVPGEKGHTGSGGAVVGPFNPQRRFSLASAGNSCGNGQKSNKTNGKDDKRRKTFDGSVGAAADDRRSSSITPTTTTTAGTTTCSSSASPPSTIRDLSPSTRTHPPRQDERHASMMDFDLDYGETLHSSASAPETPQSPPAPKHARSRRRRSDSDNNVKFESAGHFHHSGALPIGPLTSPTPISSVSGKTWWKSGSGGGGILKTVDWSVRRGSEASSAGKQAHHQDSMRSGGSDWERGGGGGGGICGTSSASASASASGRGDARAVDGRSDVADNAASASPAAATRWGLGWMSHDRSRKGGGLTDSLG